MTSHNLEMKHSDMVTRLAKPGDQILSEMSGKCMHLLHMAVGISGEAGELIDAIKKTTIYGKAIDLDNVIEELGDIEFYMRGLRDMLGISRAETLEANIAKLSKRYGDEYSNLKAQERADKQGGGEENALRFAERFDPDKQRSLPDDSYDRNRTPLRNHGIRPLPVASYHSDENRKSDDTDGPFTNPIK